MKTFTLPRPRRRILNITYQTPYESLQGTPTALPTSEPPAPQVSWTVVQSDLPTFSFSPNSQKGLGVAIAAGKNTDVVSRTVYWRVKKNGTSISTGSSGVAANTFWTLQVFFYDVIAGDVLEIALWASDAGVNWDYDAHQMQATRVFVSKAKEALSPLSCTLRTHPVLTQGSPLAYTEYLWLHPDGTTSQKLGFRESFSLAVWCPDSTTYGLWRVTDKDAGYATLRTTSTRPYYYRNPVPEKVEFYNYGQLS